MPHNGAPVRAIGDMLYGRTVRSLLALPDRGFRRSDVLAVVTGAPMRTGDGLAPGRAWERISRAAGVVGGGDWAARLAVFAADQRARADEADQDEQDRLAEHLRRDADRAEELAEFVSDLQADLAVAGRDRFVGGHGRRHPGPGVQVPGRRTPPLALARGRTTGRRPGRRSPRPAGRPGRCRRASPVGGGVSPHAGRRTRHVPAPGRPSRRRRAGRSGVDGGRARARPAGRCSAWPRGRSRRRRLEDSLLPDDERRAAGGELALRAEKVHDDHRHLLAAMAAAEPDDAVFSPRRPPPPGRPVGVALAAGRCGPPVRPRRRVHRGPGASWKAPGSGRCRRTRRGWPG